MQGAEFIDCETGFNQTTQRVPREIIQMLGVNVAIAFAQQSDRQRFQIRHQHEAKPCRLENRPGFLKKLFRLQEMLDHGPKSHRIEFLLAKIVIQEIASNHRHAL